MSTWSPAGPQPSSSSLSLQFVAGSSHTETGKPPHCIDTFNIVICGETGSGKSSLINLITGTNKAVTSIDAAGCTTGTNIVNDSLMIQNGLLNINLFDTAGLGECAQGTVPDKEARKILRKLLRTLTEQGNIHLIMYCVRGQKAIRTLRRDYELIHSQVKKKVPIVLVVTCLESYKPEMKEWWMVNERTISNLGMTFTGHACITAMTGSTHMERRAQSYTAICKLIERHYLSNETRVHTELLRGTVHNVPRTKRNTIVVFGETGAGKSSLINLMAGKNVAGTSCGIEACTTHWKEYSLEFGGEFFKVFDTVGLDEPQLGIPQYFDAIENTYTLIQNLEKEGGIDLLLFCMPAGRLKVMHQRNYQLLRYFLCDKKVPIVLAITNLEREQNMESWWTRNQKIFREKKIRVDGHACITAITTIETYPTLQRNSESHDTIWDLVKNITANGQKRAWKGRNDLFVSSIVRNGNLRVRKDIVSRLTKRCHMSPEVAKELAGRISGIKKGVVDGAT
ncbi:P-loop containing nucleoside triphosphate hydrolase protein [Suillus subaureus]|uniref:P-loop containing nucleoside triphosphate hydrolase protein n=1 Tax=Suillus subaureus TaxID=48587 RepID=A0A9P7EP23_9AGAM|nr:P-loop containing nucleoside triphosphate hydrolase protein [Suillus subaureus]KAG1827361.1 P-loop containing nucleoside triphosphate hydrolase protein [Suillus subaureus]